MSNNVPYEFDNDGCRVYSIDSLGEKKVRISERNGVKDSSVTSSDITAGNLHVYICVYIYIYIFICMLMCIVENLYTFDFFIW
jgi:hypothetical protein